MTKSGSPDSEAEGAPSPSLVAAMRLVPLALPEDAYRKWPGLVNPLASRPVQPARERWAKLHAHTSVPLRVEILFYRFRRGIRKVWRAIVTELTEAPLKTLGEVVLGLIVAALPIDPYRDWISRQWFGWWLILAAAIGSLALAAFRHLGERRATTVRIRRASELLQLVIESARTHIKESADGTTPSAEHLKQSLAVMLQAVADMVSVVLQVPDDVKLHANLMIPMPVLVEGDPIPRNGLGIVAYSIKRPSSMAWTRLVMGEFGAGEAYETSQVQVIEDTRDPRWCGVFTGIRSSCFASIPVLEGSGKAFAVVNIDADRETVLTRRNAYDDVYQVVVGAVALIGDVLHNTQTGGPGPTKRSSRRSRRNR